MSDVEPEGDPWVVPSADVSGPDALEPTPEAVEERKRAAERAVEEAEAAEG